MIFLLLGVLFPRGGMSFSQTLPDSLPSPPEKRFQDPWWGQDKAWHFAVSHTLSNTLVSQTSLPCSASVGISLGVGLAKEIVDLKIRRTFFSWKDLLYDTLGAVLGCMP